MANNDAPHGLAAIASMSGGPFLVQKMTKDSGGGTAIFKGDVVSREADSFIAPGGTPGTTIISGVSLDYGAASTETNHLVIIDPYVIFDAQDNGDGLAQADEGLNCNLEYNAGSATTKLSGHEIDGSTKAVTATLDVMLVRLIPASNNAYGANARFEVIINAHRMAPAQVGV